MPRILSVLRSLTSPSKFALPALVLLSLIMVLLSPLDGAPREDAAMLMRYAEHVALGHGMVWNIGEAPVDGATDFLFTVVVAAVRATGLEIQIATKAVIVVAWVLTAVVVYVSARRVVGVPPLVAFVATVPVVIGPGILYAAFGYGAPVFGFWTATSAALTLALVQQPSRRWLSGLLGVAVLLLGLTRPEGVLLAALLALAVVVRLGLRSAAVALRRGVLIFLVLGGAYFVWRWWYFGYPLPNPYYKKGGLTLHVDGFRDSVKGALRFVFPFGALWIPALCNRSLRRLAMAWALPIAGFTAIWVLLSPEMNDMYRFQYPVLVLTAVFWPVLFKRLRDRATATRGRSYNPYKLMARHPALTVTILTVALLIPTISLVRPFASLSAAPSDKAGPRLLLHPYSIDNRAIIGGVLAPYASKGYTVATTEAGLIPLRSRWRALDTWGLNDQEIAHRGYLTATDLDRRSPVVVFVHQSYTPGEQPHPDLYLGQPWTDMTVTLNTWLTDNGYHLVRSVDNLDRQVVGHSSTWNIWVAPTTPDSRELAQLLGCQTYRGQENVAPVAVAQETCTAQ